MQPRLEREEPGRDQVDDVEVAVTDAEDGELEFEARRIASFRQVKRNSGMISTPTMLAMSW